MRTYRTFIPKLSEKDSEKYYIRLSMDMLLDARYNPFTEGSSDNEKVITNCWTIGLIMYRYL